MADTMSGAQARRIRFGPFEADAAAGELRKDGRLIRLQEQPFQVLLALLDRAGEVVTREELRQRLWPDDTFGDFDQGLNTAINKLREALGDSAAGPKFVETVPKRGYRFIHVLESETPALQPPAVRPRAPWRWVAGGAALVLLAILVVSVRSRTTAPPPQLPLRRFSIDPTVSLATRAFFDPVAAASPNGRYIAYITDENPGRICVHDLEQGVGKVFPGTEGARRPFWSPDSEFFGFAAGGGLKTIRVRDGSTGLLCQDCGRDYFGATWSPDGQSIVFAEGAPSSLFEIPAAGGARRPLLTAEQLRYRDAAAPNPKEIGYLAGPQFLPEEAGRRVILFAAGYVSATILVRDLESGREEVLWQSAGGDGTGGSAVYSRSGHVLYRPQPGAPEIWARPFSLRTLKATGEAFQVLKGGADISVADDGTLVYVDAPSTALTWMNRKGVKISSVGEPLESFFYPALSPDGRRAAVETMENANLDIWVYDLERGARTRLTSHPATDIVPVWSPDSERIAFSSYKPGNIDVFLAPADGSAGEKAIVSGPTNERVSDWSSDGRRIVYSLLTADNGYDIWYAEQSGAGGWNHMPFLQTPSNEYAAKLSPDGRYVAYLSNETGRDEIFVRPFPAGGRKWPISTNGGRQVRWRRDGRELYYTYDGGLFGVPVQTAPEFRPGTASRLFSNPAFQAPWLEANYDVAPDGERFLIPERMGGARKIHVVQNWFAAFRK
jgi:Tol biopolymer transport system component/DNA-binding winged helix-turn-helix (wHTH) protein